MKIRVEIGSLATPRITGVGNYTKLLINSLSTSRSVSNTVYGFYFNFLNHQSKPTDLDNSIAIRKDILIPQRVYAKLHSYGIKIPFDIFQPTVDLTILPNYARWNTCNSKLTATVVHDLTFLKFPEYMEEKNLAYLRRVVPDAIKKSDFIITVSDHVKQEIINTYDIDPSRCISTPIPPDDIYFKKSSKEIHQKYNIPTKKYIYFIGTIEPRKNVTTLINAYISLPSDIKEEYSLVLAGGYGWKTGPIREVLQDALDTKENIIHIGYIDQEDASSLHQKASLFIQPSTYEGFGMPILEAMASETPVLTSDIPVFREVGGDAVLFSDPHNHLSFTNNIKKILQSPEIQQQMIRKGVQNLRRFSWDYNAKKVTETAESILSV